jgi:hypothetical protein
LTFERSLSLANNNLTGPIPSSFQIFPNLTWLDLSNNQLEGGLNHLANNAFLEYLDLSHNSFSTLSVPNGSLANWVPSTFPSLRFFDLRNNSFVFKYLFFCFHFCFIWVAWVARVARVAVVAVVVLDYFDEATVTLRF